MSRSCRLLAVGLLLLACLAVGEASAHAAEAPTTLPRPTTTVVAVTTDAGVAVADAGSPGWWGTADAEANLLGVTWRGDADATFAVESRERVGDGSWSQAGEVGRADVAPDAVTDDARMVAEVVADPVHHSEPVWVGHARSFKVTVLSGTATDVHAVAILSLPSATESAPAATSSSLLPIGWPFGTLIDDPRPIVAVASVGVALGIAIVCALARRRSVRGRRARHRGVAVGALALASVAVTGCTFVMPGAPSGVPNPPLPTMTMRTSWASGLANDGWNPSDECAPGPVYAPTLKFAVVHHTVNANTYAAGDSPGIVRAIWQYHVGTLGYCDIGYNFLVDRFGVIFEGRRGGIDKPVVAAHTGGFNTGSTGAAFIGTYSVEQPPVVSWNAMVNLLAWKLSIHFVDPSRGFTATSGGAGARWPAGTVVSFPSAIVGHRDLWPTECPGNAFYPRLGVLRAVVQPLVGWKVPLPTPTS